LEATLFRLKWAVKGLAAAGGAHFPFTARRRRTGSSPRAIVAGLRRDPARRPGGVAGPNWGFCALAP